MRCELKPKSMFKEAAQSSMENNNADLIRVHGRWGFISKKIIKTVELLAQIRFFKGTLCEESYRATWVRKS